MSTFEVIIYAIMLITLVAWLFYKLFIKPLKKEKKQKEDKSKNDTSKED